MEGNGLEGESYLPTTTGGYHDLVRNIRLQDIGLSLEVYVC